MVDRVYNLGAGSNVNAEGNQEVAGRDFGRDKAQVGNERYHSPAYDELDERGDDLEVGENDLDYEVNL